MNQKGFELHDHILRLITKLSDTEEKLTPEERSKLQAWLNESAENEKYFRSLKEVWRASALPKPPSLTGEVVSEMMEKLREHTTLTSTPNKTLSILRSKRKAAVTGQGNIESRWAIWTMRIAAVLVLSVGIYWVQQWLQKNGLEQEPLPYQEFTAENAQKLQLWLSDGSLVHLNAASQLRVPSTFSQESREIFLEGEAFFDVVHGSIPFVVNTELGKIEDIGTAFNVRMRENLLRVVVAKGEVALYPQANKEKLPELSQPLLDRIRLSVSSGQMAGYSAEGRLEMPHRVDVEKFLAWRKNVLIFEKTPLDEVLQELTRQYDLEFQIKAGLNRRSITAQFKGLTADQVLSKLSLITDLSFQRDGQKVFISEP